MSCVYDIKYFGKVYAIEIYCGTNRKENKKMNKCYETNAPLATRTGNGGDFGLLINELDRLFDFPVRSVSSHAWSPISAHESENGYRYDLEIPGLKKDGLEVTLTDSVLAVKGQKRVFRDGAESLVEIERSLLIPEDVDPDKIQARYTDGILTVEIAKPERVKPKTIQVNVE